MEVFMSLTDAIIVKLPWICECGCITSKLASVNNPANPKHAADAICADCGKRCASVNGTTMRTLTSIAEKFGTPVEPVIFRSPKTAMAKIEQQDLFLKTHYARDGRSMYDIITDVLNTPLSIEDEPPSDSDGLEAVED
jgi:hypothetical protein